MRRRDTSTEQPEHARRLAAEPQRDDTSRMRPTVSPLGSSTSNPASRAQNTRAGAELTRLTPTRPPPSGTRVVRDACVQVTAENLSNR